MYTVTNFLSTFRTKSTRETYYYAIKRCLEIILGCKIKKDELDSVCEDYFSHIACEHENSLDDDLAQFPAKVETEHLAPKSVRLYVQIMIMYAKERGISVSGKAERIFKTETPKNLPISREAELDSSTFQKILTDAPIRLKTEIMILASSGMRISELLKITDEDIDLKSIPATITLRPNYTKTKTGRIIYISSEAADSLKNWMMVRNQLMERGIIKPDETRIFPYSKSNETAYLRRHLNKCGLLETDPATHRSTIHFHLFRKFFLTEFKLTASPEVAEELAGHKGYLSDSYRRLPHKTMKEEYLKAEHAFTFMAVKTGYLLETKAQAPGAEFTFEIHGFCRNYLLNRLTVSISDKA